MKIHEIVGSQPLFEEKEDNTYKMRQRKHYQNANYPGKNKDLIKEQQREEFKKAWREYLDKKY